MPNKFANGCPTCGYAVGKGQKIPAPSQKETKATRKSKRALLNAIDSRNSGASRAKVADGSLPVWSFFAIVGILVLFVCCAMKYLEIS